ncbi:MAG: glycosyltransferase [Dehalococcoidales bacterium]|nr:glycosyltransferase [Dehalococcoidales bacterium]
MSNSVSLIIPTYKEHDNIAPLMERIHQALHAFDYRVLLVDDDSNDGTAELAASLSSKYPVDIFVRKNKRGLASAVVDGIARATGDTVVVMDADLQHPPEVLPDLVLKIDESADMAIASRYVPGGGCEGWGLARRIN